MPNYKIEFTESAVKAVAEAKLSLKAVEDRARQEIAAVFGNSLDLERYFRDYQTYISLAFDMPGLRFQTWPLSPQAWEVCCAAPPAKPQPPVKDGAS